jgi:hypothetical protein
MKKILLMLVAAFAFSTAFADGHMAFPDVPEGHWAADAVEEIADANIVIGFPDGTFRGDDSFTRYQAALMISRTITHLESMEAQVEVDSSAIRDLRNQVAAQRVATDQALADLAGVQGDVDNLREFVILLRRDAYSLTQRVSALEEATAGMDALEARVSSLEANPLGLSGKIEVDYDVDRYSAGFAGGFDVDRAFGTGLSRSLGESVFSTGTDADANSSGSSDSKVDADGEYAQDRNDFDGTGASKFEAKASISGSYKFDGAGSPNGLNSFSASADVKLVEVGTTLNDTDGDAISQPYVLSLSGFSTEFDPIGASPLTFGFGEEVNVSWTPYTLGLSKQNALTAALGAPDQLAFVDPALNFAYVTTDGAANSSYTPAVIEPSVLLAVRGTMSPIEGVSGGVTYVRQDFNTVDKDDHVEDNDKWTVLGLDTASTLGPVSLTGEYARATENLASSTTNTTLNAYYVKATADLSDVLPGLSIGGNYRSVDTGYNSFGQISTGYDIDDSTTPATLTDTNPRTITDSDDYPFDAGFTGFAVDASATVSILTVSGYYDSYSNMGSDLSSATDDTAIVALGGKVSAALGMGFSAAANYDRVTDEGTVVKDDDTNGSDDYSTGLGASLTHDGSDAAALIENLNLSASYAQSINGTGSSLDTTDIDVNGDYTVTVAGVTATPYAGYAIDNGPDTVAKADATELTAGTGLTTAALDVIFAPSLEAAVNYRNTTYTNASDFSASELQYAVGLNLGEFLVPNSTFGATYVSWAGTNADYGGSGVSNDDGSAGDDATYGDTSVTGYELEWNYFDLVMGYGVYTHTDSSDVSDSAQAFSVAYSVAF